MEYIVTAEQMKAHESYIMENVGMDASVLMERAALFAACTIQNMIDKRERLLIVCGTGNNGADGLALARILTEEGYRPDVLLLGNKEKYTTLRQRQEKLLDAVLDEEGKLRVFQGLTDTKKRQTEYAVIVDAILGIGVSRELSGVFKDAVDWMNTLTGYKIAMDVPTGICSDTGRMLGTAFRADKTLTFGLKKQGLMLGEGKVHAGKVKLDSCGMCYPSMNKELLSGNESLTFRLTKSDVQEYIRRNPLGNKSTFGKLGFLAGSETIAGAAILNVTAAFRSGGGYVRLCTHESNKEAVLSAAPEAVLDLYDTDCGVLSEKTAMEKILSLISFADVICVGSELGTTEQSKVLLECLLKGLADKQEKILILDADALNLVAKNGETEALLRNVQTHVIMTPHVVEFARLSGKTPEEIKADCITAAREYARTHHCILVLKDAQIVVADEKGKVCISAKGNDGMAVAGSGDVLAGVIAGVAGQVKEPYISACTGVYLHGMAGDISAQIHGAHSMLPTDVIQCLKKCMKKLGKEAMKHEIV